MDTDVRWKGYQLIKQINVVMHILYLMRKSVCLLWPSFACFSSLSSTAFSPCLSFLFSRLGFLLAKHIKSLLPWSVVTMLTAFWASSARAKTTKPKPRHPSVWPKINPGAVSNDTNTLKFICKYCVWIHLNQSLLCWNVSWSETVYIFRLHESCWFWEIKQLLICSEGFTAFCVSLMKGMAANFPVVGRVVRKVEPVHNRAQVAQLIEHRVVIREVVSSTPAGPTLRVFK